MDWEKDKEFFIWAFGQPKIEITCQTFDLALSKLYEVYNSIKDGTVRKRYLTDKISEHLTKSISDKDNSVS